MAKTAKKDVLSIQEQIKADLAKVKSRVEPPSGFIISTKGKTFTLPDGRQDDGPIRCVILDWVTENIFFEGMFDPKNIQPPTCFALGREVAELAPSDKSPDKQHNTCHGCKQNEWGSRGKGKACKNTRRLLIVEATADEHTQPYIIRVSPTGLKHFDKYINTLADMGKHPIEAVTEIAFDEAEAYPSLRFSASGVADNVELMWSLKERGQEILFQEPNVE